MMNGQCLATTDQSCKEPLNPFVHHLELTTTYEKIIAGILTVVVLPIRLLFIICLLVLAWMLACVGLFGLSEADLQRRPLTSWRRKTRELVALLGYWTYYAGGMRYTVKGKQAPRHEAPILVIAPHSTFFDAGICYVTGFPSIIVRRESGLHPFMGKLINFTQPVYVSRDDPESRQKTIKQIIDRATSPLDWSQMLIFPEGTCTNRSCLITFKPGAFNPGVPVQPVILRYPNKLDTVTWTWQGPGALKLIWLTLVQLYSKCEVEFLPVYKPSAAEKRDPKLFADNVRQLMARALGVPTVDYSYDDCQLVAKADKLSIPRTCLILKIYKLRIRMGLAHSQKEEKLVAENPEMIRSEHMVNYDQFAKILAVPPSEPGLRDLFALQEPDSNGQVDLSKYLLGVLMVDQAINKEHMLQMAFELCGDNERLNRKQLATLMQLGLQMSPKDVAIFSKEVPVDHQGLISYYTFDSYMKKRPELELASYNNNRRLVKAD